MLARIDSLAVLGVKAFLVHVEVDLAPGLPAFSTVGLPDGAVRESKDRVRAAISNSGFVFPLNRITVNLAPAGVRKEGAGFDLPMALGILAAGGVFPSDRLTGCAVVGELALDGAIRPVRGILPMAVAAKELGYSTLIVPRDNGPEAAVVEGLTVLQAGALHEVVFHLMGQKELSEAEADIAALMAQAMNRHREFQRGQGPGER
jgi:magnesium chelatase family protein